MFVTLGGKISALALFGPSAHGAGRIIAYNVTGFGRYRGAVGTRL
jgi:hypothetical protein